MGEEKNVTLEDGTVVGKARAEQREDGTIWVHINLAEKVYVELGDTFGVLGFDYGHEFDIATDSPLPFPPHETHNLADREDPPVKYCDNCYLTTEHPSIRNKCEEKKD